MMARFIKKIGFPTKISRKMAIRCCIYSRYVSMCRSPYSSFPFPQISTVLKKKLYIYMCVCVYTHTHLDNNMDYGG